MKIDFSKVINDLAGKPVKQTADAASPEVTLGFLSLLALYGESQDPLEKKLQCYKLMQLIHDAKVPVDITPEQATLLKEKIGAQQPPMVVGRAVELLNG